MDQATMQAIVDGLTKEIKALQAELKAAMRRGDSRTSQRCRNALSVRHQIRRRRQAELKAAKERTARAQARAEELRIGRNAVTLGGMDPADFDALIRAEE